MILIEVQGSTRKKVGPIATVSIKSVTCLCLGLKLCPRSGRPATNSLSHEHFKWFLSYKEQPIDSVQENICLLRAAYRIFNYITAEFINAKRWYICLPPFFKSLKQFKFPVVAIKPFQAVRNARSDVRTGAVCQSMNSATLW